MSFISKIKSFVWTKHFLKNLGYIVLTYFGVILLTIFYLDFSTNHGEKISVPILVGKMLNLLQVLLRKQTFNMKY
jgi:eukaryotic-like serine/threonine-protein kinase